MNNMTMTLLALAVSCIAMLYLRNTDSKRRRSHRMPSWDKPRYTSLAWTISFIPGVVLLTIDATAAFIMWLAAFSLIGWLIALPKPQK